MSSCSPTETFIIYFISCLHSLLAPSPPARKLRVNIQLQGAPILKVTTVFPLLINYKHSTGPINRFMHLIHVQPRTMAVLRQGVSMSRGQRWINWSWKTLIISKRISNAYFFLHVDSTKIYKLSTSFFIKSLMLYQCAVTGVSFKRKKEKRLLSFK